MDSNSFFQNLKTAFASKHSSIKNSFIEKHKNTLSALTTYPANIAAGTMGGIMLLTNVLPSVPVQSMVQVEKKITIVDSQDFLISDLHNVLPPEVGELTHTEEKDVGEILSRTFRIPVSAELEGVRLNRSYGLIGQEQHLALYPGDSIQIHFENNEDAVKHAKQGMAPGLGAWGYFANSKLDVSQKDIEREKYYIAVQTFLAPGFDTHVKEYITFFKFRKMILINPENGKAIITDIADAGPGESTGKHLGGSPEVMRYLERVDGAQRGPVLYFFVDDPKDQIPLGPIQSM